MAFPNLFANGTIRLAIGLELGKYIYAACGNWDNYKPEDEFAGGNAEDKESEDIKKPLGN